MCKINDEDEINLTKTHNCSREREEGKKERKIYKKVHA